MKIGIIGTGKHGSRYANHIFHDIDGLTIAAISRQSPLGKQQAEEWQCRYFQQWPDLINDPAVEAVIAAVPPFLNLEIGKTCAAAKKPLLLEKPLATSLNDGEEIISCFARADLGLTIGQTLRYNPMIQAARKHIGSIGQIHSIIAQHHLEPSEQPWLQDPVQAGAGVSLQTAVHVFDALTYITGLKVKRVWAADYQFYNPGLEDLVSATLEFDNGAVGLIQASKICPARLGGYQFLGAQGLLNGDQIYNELEIISGTTRTPITLHPGVMTIKQLLIDWLAFIEGTGENPIPGEVGLSALKTCVACLESNKTKNWVEI